MVVTEKCVICLSAANRFSGHLHKGERIVISGYCCEEHRKIGLSHEGRVDCEGCCGDWKKEYGYRILNTYKGGIEELLGVKEWLHSINNCYSK